MRPQIEKSKEQLLENIEQLSNEPLTDKLAEYLSVYRGAYKALCMVCGKESDYTPEAAQSEPQAARTVDIPIGTEFEQIFATIPADTPHMKALTAIINDHLEWLKITNNRKYENIMMRLREVAEH